MVPSVAVGRELIVAAQEVAEPGLLLVAGGDGAVFFFFG